MASRSRVIAGSAGGVTGPVRDIVADPDYLDVTMGPKRIVLPAGEGRLHGVGLRDWRGRDV